MYNFTFRFRTLLMSLLLTGLAAGSSFAQNQMQARNYQDNRTFRTTNPELAVDEFISTSAKVEPTLIGDGILRVTFPTAVQPGQQASLVIKSSTSLATVLGGMALKAFDNTSQNPDRPVQYAAMSDQSTIQISTAPSDPDARMVKFTATKVFNQLELDITTLLNTNYSVDVYAVFASVAPLPVELTSFQGKATPAGIALLWQTASERNADYFEVQRAEGLSDSFRSLGQVKCTGNSTQAHTYQFVDAAVTGLRYYRLRQVDENGQESFSPVVAVEGGAVAAALAAYPTLATQTLTITGPAGMRLSLFNQRGERVADLAASPTQQLDVRSLPGGVYFLRDATTGQRTRFIKASGE